MIKKLDKWADSKTQKEFNKFIIGIIGIPMAAILFILLGTNIPELFVNWLLK